MKKQERLFRGKVYPVLAAIGVVAFFTALHQDPARAWGNLLISNVYFLSLSLIGIAFVAIQYVAKAGWPTLFRRIPEALTAYLPVGALLTALTYFGMHDLYHWSHHEAVAHDAVLAAKHAYLNVPMYFIRAGIFFALWMVFSHLIISRSRAQDQDGRTEHTHANVRLSALFLVLFAFTYSLASIDWIMSLEPHWYSTIFPWYVFSGAFVHGAAVITLLLIFLNKRGFFQETNKHHLHDLGKYIFAFSVFWGYLWFSQYLLIWYSNIPEETAYFLTRSGAWHGVFWVNPIINLLLPFMLLLSAYSKRIGPRMISACALIVFGHWIDIYQMVMPAITHDGPHMGWQECFIFLGLGSIFLLLFERSFLNHPPQPEKDPYLVESLHHTAS